MQLGDMIYCGSVSFQALCMAETSKDYGTVMHVLTSIPSGDI